MTRTLSLVSVLLLLPFVYARYYSCDDLERLEMKPKLSLPVGSTNQYNYMCIVTQENYTNWKTLDKIEYDQESFKDIAKKVDHCKKKDKSSDKEAPWKLKSAATPDCSQQFVAIFSFDEKKIVESRGKVLEHTVKSKVQSMFVSPRGGLWLHKQQCKGTGNVAIYSDGASHKKDQIHSWPCSSMPDWILTFDAVLMVEVEKDLELVVYHSSSIDSTIQVKPGESIAVIASGQIDRRPISAVGYRASFQLPKSEARSIRVRHDANDNKGIPVPASRSSMSVQTSTNPGSIYSLQNQGNATFTTDYFEIRYARKYEEKKLGENKKDTLIAEISIAKDAHQESTTTTTTAADPVITPAPTQPPMTIPIVVTTPPSTTPVTSTPAATAVPVTTPASTAPPTTSTAVTTTTTSKAPPQTTPTPAKPVSTTQAPAHVTSSSTGTVVLVVAGLIVVLLLVCVLVALCVCTSAMSSCCGGGGDVEKQTIVEYHTVVEKEERKHSHASSRSPLSKRSRRSSSSSSSSSDPSLHPDEDSSASESEPSLHPDDE